MTSFLKKIWTPCLLVGVLFFIPNGFVGQDVSLFKVYGSAGVSSSQVSGDQLTGFDQLGISLGIGTELQIDKVWKPRMELLFTQMGSRKNARPDENDFDSYLLRLNYVQLPLTMSYFTGSTGFEIGLAPAYLLSSREEDENGTVRGIGREFKDYDLGGLIGIRYLFAQNWELSTRLIQSLTPIRDHTGNSTFRLNQGQYNTAIQFMLRFHV